MASYKSLFEKYQDHSVLLKSRDYARWTLPKLMAEFSQYGSTAQVERDYQEIGALLVNSLSSKLTALLFPSNRPFFGISPSKELRELAESKGITEAQLNAGLAQREMEASQRVFLNSSYNQLTLSMAHLIVTGNACVYRDSKSATTVTYGVNSFGVRRTGKGIVADAIVREFESFAGLSRDLQVQLAIRFPHKYKMDAHDVNIAVYTRIQREYGKTGDPYYRISQEVEGMKVGTDGTYPERLCPWQFPTWTLIAGEHYGRGMVEDYSPGFAAISDKSEALALYGIAAMKFVNLVTPGSGVSVDDIASAETGEYVSGSNGAVQVQETGNGQKIAAMRSEIEHHFSNLSRAFMYTANTRDAERVTAYELRQAATEANTMLGGQYSALAESYQGPTAHILLTEVEPGALEGIVSGHTKIDVIAGIPALSRGIDVQNIVSASQDAAAIVPVLMQLDNRIDRNKLMDLIYAGQSVNTSRIHREPSEQAEYEAAQQQGQQANEDIQQLGAASDQIAALQALPGATG